MVKYDSKFCESNFLQSLEHPSILEVKSFLYYLNDNAKISSYNFKCTKWLVYFYIPKKDCLLVYIFLLDFPRGLDSIGQTDTVQAFGCPEEKD